MHPQLSYALARPGGRAGRPERAGRAACTGAVGSPASAEQAGVAVGNGIRQLAERLWQGETTVEETRPFSLIREAEEVADGVAFVPSFADVTAFRTGEGLVLVDTGSAPLAGHVHSTLRGWER